MNKSEIMPILERLGVVPSRKLGQNFLVDRNCLDSMVRIASPQASEMILEVGPGTGVLTRRLLAAGCRVLAVELDHRLAAYLKSEFSGRDDIAIIEDDACKLDYVNLPWLAESGSYRCIANLPYSCGSVFLSKICACSCPPKELFVLLQREMGERLAAGVGSKQYGSLTVRLALRYEIAIEKIVSPGVFYPPPDVESAFVSLKRRDDVSPEMSDLFQKVDNVVICAFSQRRKKVIRLLESMYPKEKIAVSFARLALDGNVRAEELSPEEFWALTRQLES